MRIRPRSLAIAVPLIVLCCVAGPYTLLGASEYLRPTTMELVSLPDNCVRDQGTTPSELTEFIEKQQAWYGLTPQKVMVCRTARPLGDGQTGIIEEVFDSQSNGRWLPSKYGCCTFAFRRHYIIEAAINTPSGATVVMAALIQSRYRYWHFLGWNTGLKFRLWL